MYKPGAKASCLWGQQGSSLAEEARAGETPARPQTGSLCYINVVHKLLVLEPDAYD